LLAGQPLPSGNSHPWQNVAGAPSDILFTVLGVDQQRDTPDIIRTICDGNSLEFIAGLTGGGLTGRPELSRLVVEAPEVAATCTLLQDIVKTPPARLATVFEAPEASLANFSELARDMLAAAGRLLDMRKALPEPDIVIATDLVGLIAGVVAKSSNDVPLFYDMHGDFASGHDFPRPVRAFWQGVEKSLAAHADACFAASEALAAELSGRFGRSVVPFPDRWPGEMQPGSSKMSQAIQRDEGFADLLFQAMPNEIAPAPQVALEAYVARHRMIEVRPLIVNGVSTIRWNPQTLRVDEIPPEFGPMSGGRIGMSVHLPYTTDLNCLYLALDDHAPSAAIEIESLGPGGSSAPKEVTFDSNGEFFLPWTGNLTSRIFLRMRPAPSGIVPRVRAFRMFTLCAGMG
jgi:hypothetical protein